MRLIDADALKKAIPETTVDASTKYRYCVTFEREDVLAIIDDAPTVDAVEVVRCKDCRHMEKSQYGRYCQIWGMYNGHGDDGFCCYGERKEGAD